MDLATFLMLVFIAIALWFGGNAVWRLYRAGRVVVYEHEAGLKYRDGRLVEVLGPGRYPTWPHPVEITKLDIREQSAVVPGQEILTSDQLPVRVSLIVTHRVKDPRLNAAAAVSPIARLYQVSQIAMREAVARRALDDLLTHRDEAFAGVADAISTQVVGLGFEIISVKLLDLTLAGPAKQAYADLWRAQKEGLTALERARGEQAALRALANAARMLKDNPELMNLRILQTLQATPGKNPPTLVLGGAPGLVPTPRNAQVPTPDQPEE